MRVSTLLCLAFALCALVLWTATSVVGITENEQAMLNKIKVKVRQRQLIEKANMIKLLANVESRHAAQFALFAHLSQEEIQFLLDQGIFDVFVDFVVQATGTVVTWVQTQANTVANEFNSKIAGPISGWTAGALDTTKTWVSGAYGTTSQGFSSFCTEVKNGYGTATTQITNQLNNMRGVWGAVENYITSGGLENDVKRIGKMLEGALKKVCDFPGAQSLMRAAISAGLQAAVCAATNLQAPGCAFPLPLSAKAKLLLYGQLIKCSAFNLLELFSGLCSGINDFLADTLAAIEAGTSYDMVANVAVGCACGGCPGTCSYNNRAICLGKWWIASATEFVAMVTPTPSGTPSGTPTTPAAAGFVNIFGDVKIMSVWYGQSIGNGGMDVTAHFCKQLAGPGDKLQVYIYITNAVLGGDPTYGLAKAIFIRYKLLSRGETEYLYFKGPAVNEGYTVRLIDLVVAADEPMPGTFVGTRKVRVVRAFWTPYALDTGGKGPWTTDESTWPPDTRNSPQGNDVTAYLWNQLRENENKFVTLSTSTFGDPGAGKVKTMIMLYQMDEGQGFVGNTRLGVLKLSESSAGIYPEQFPILKPSLRVVSALYGVEDMLYGISVAAKKDVTSIVSRAFDLADVLLVNNKNMGGDPAQGQVKYLSIVYMKNPAASYATITYIVGENQYISVKELMNSNGRTVDDM